MEYEAVCNQPATSKPDLDGLLRRAYASISDAETWRELRLQRRLDKLNLLLSVFEDAHINGHYGMRIVGVRGSRLSAICVDCEAQLSVEWTDREAVAEGEAFDVECADARAAA